MRHYVPIKRNPDWLPHDLYMQMLYLIRDYEKCSHEPGTSGRKKQWAGVRLVCSVLKEEYKKRPAVYGALDPLRAFFDYPYYSVMFAQPGSDMGAGKRAWNAFRCHFACLVAKTLQLYSC